MKIGIKIFEGDAQGVGPVPAAQGFFTGRQPACIPDPFEVSVHIEQGVFNFPHYSFQAIEKQRADPAINFKTMLFP
jgi:hypothetical protein